MVESTARCCCFSGGDSRGREPRRAAEAAAVRADDPHGPPDGADSGAPLTSARPRAGRDHLGRRRHDSEHRGVHDGVRLDCAAPGVRNAADLGRLPRRASSTDRSSHRSRPTSRPSTRCRRCAARGGSRLLREATAWSRWARRDSASPQPRSCATSTGTTSRSIALTRHGSQSIGGRGTGLRRSDVCKRADAGEPPIPVTRGTTTH